MLFHPAFSEISNSDHKMNQLSYSQSENKTHKQSSAKNLNLQPSGSSALNASNNSNGVYVDLGKALLEAAKAGDADKVQECIKNGAPFITDWVSKHKLLIILFSTSAFTLLCVDKLLDPLKKTPAIQLNF